MKKIFDSNVLKIVLRYFLDFTFAMVLMGWIQKDIKNFHWIATNTGNRLKKTSDNCSQYWNDCDALVLLFTDLKTIKLALKTQ